MPHPSVSGPMVRQNIHRVVGMSTPVRAAGNRKREKEAGVSIYPMVDPNDILFYVTPQVLVTV